METLDMVAAFKADKGPNSNPNQEKIDEIVSELENEILIYRKKLTSGEYNGEGEEPTTEQKNHRTKIEKMLRKAQALKNGEKINAEEEGETSLEDAERIMGDRFFGPEQISKLGIAAETIPEIPFTEEQLEMAKQMGMDLILYSDKLDNGETLTGKTLIARIDNKQSDGGKMLHNSDWYKNEKFFIDQSPTGQWKLTTRENIPKSGYRNYLEQTKELANYILSLYNNDKTRIPENILSAIEEAIILTDDRTAQKAIESTDETIQKSMAEKLSKLPLNQMFRESFIECLYRIAVIEKEKSSNTGLLNSTYTWTNSVSSGSGLVRFGSLDAGGAFVDGCRPQGAVSYLGLCFSAAKL